MNEPPSASEFGTRPRPTVGRVSLVCHRSSDADANVAPLLEARKEYDTLN